MDTVGLLDIADGAEVLVDRSRHRPMVVVRGGPPGVSLASNLAGLLSGIELPGAALKMTQGGAQQYEYRIPWDTSVHARVSVLGLLLGDLVNAVEQEMARLGDGLIARYG